MTQPASVAVGEWIARHWKIVPQVLTVLGALVAQGVLHGDALEVSRVVLIVGAALGVGTYVAPSNAPKR